MALPDPPSSQDDILETTAPNFPPARVKESIQELFGLEGDLSPLESERDQNFCLTTQNGEKLVVKIANKAEKKEVVDFQIKALEHIAVADPGLLVPRVIPSMNGKAIEVIQAKDGSQHLIRVLTYLTGRNPYENPTHFPLLRATGKYLARLGLALRGFFHPAADFELLWDAKQASKLKQYVDYVPDPQQREMVTYYLDRFDRLVLPKLPTLRAQIIHNDLGPDNMLVSEDDPGKITGVIDFGDMVHSPLVIDVADTMTSMMYRSTHPLEHAKEYLAGYNEITPLEPVELSLLYDLCAIRMTMSIIIAHWRVTIHPYNEEYIMDGLERIWDTLVKWRALDPEHVTRSFFRICGFWELAGQEEKPATKKETPQAHLKRRDELLGPCYYLFYERPLHIVRGEGVWLYDIDGSRYLDVYNNVPHVGHCHPHVVNAISKQARKLNTSTRYMHSLILELAGKIKQRMPDPLSVCFFVCTGSEANELAWRMAKVVSGSSGVMVTKNAYHGNSSATILFSPEELPADKIPSHIETIFAPTSNTDFKDPDSGIGDAIKALDKKCHSPAMLLVDTIFSSDGVFTSPKGYLDTLFAITRSAGGLCVADEVQAGFGRLGKHFWGFEFDEVIPDIVTMGKPMGNGHPLAAAVTTPEISQALADETGYFNTFGGNPVSCAAGLAVLEVIEKEGLQRNALEVGQYIQDKIIEMRTDHPQIGDFHGSGLFIGIEIVKEDDSPDPQKAEDVMNHMRENGVLIGTTGPLSSILKIRPPIVFQREHADILIQAMKKAVIES
jgi:4-aminobutyrate aminotransferase-like enzyme/Ser/Thr protein kinase RdoA (MazF antagonist)